jgi:hypothetical protein
MDPLTAAIVACISGFGGLGTAVTAWVKSKSEVEKVRAERVITGKQRDEDSQKMHDDLIRMQCKQTEFESNIKILFEQSIKNSNDINELSKQHAEVMVTLKNILETLKEIKDNQ